jgi:hypothetical protein
MGAQVRHWAGPGPAACPALTPRESDSPEGDTRAQRGPPYGAGGCAGPWGPGAPQGALGETGCRAHPRDHGAFSSGPQPLWARWRAGAWAGLTPGGWPRLAWTTWGATGRRAPRERPERVGRNPGVRPWACPRHSGWRWGMLPGVETQGRCAPLPVHRSTHTATGGPLRPSATRALPRGTPLRAPTTAATIARHGGAEAVVALPADGPPRSPPQPAPIQSPWLRGRAVRPRPACWPATRARYDRQSDHRSDGHTAQRLAPRRDAVTHRDRRAHTTAGSRARLRPRPLASSAAPRRAARF